MYIYTRISPATIKRTGTIEIYYCLILVNSLFTPYKKRQLTYCLTNQYKELVHYIAVELRFDCRTGCNFLQKKQKITLPENTLCRFVKHMLHRQ